MRAVLLLAVAALAAIGQEVKRPRVSGVAHVALAVADVSKARGFYKDFLGYEEPFDLKNPDGSLALTFIKINERQYLEIFPEKEPGSDRLLHVALEVDDAEAMRAYFKSKGFTVPEKVGKGRTGNKNFTTKDPEGHLVEFVEYQPDSWTAREHGKYLGRDRISTRMTHFGILVGELDKEIRFYRDVLGFEETWRGSSDGKVLSWVNMRTPGGDDYIEFMLYRDLPEPAKRGTPHHICLGVPDMEKAVAALEARPARKLYTRPIEPRTGVNRRRLLNLYDPDGTRVELMEPRTVDGQPTPPSTAPPPR